MPKSSFKLPAATTFSQLESKEQAILLCFAPCWSLPRFPFPLKFFISSFDFFPCLPRHYATNKNVSSHTNCNNELGIVHSEALERLTHVQASSYVQLENSPSSLMYLLVAARTLSLSQFPGRQVVVATNTSQAEQARHASI